MLIASAYQEGINSPGDRLNRHEYMLKAFPQVSESRLALLSAMEMVSVLACESASVSAMELL